MINKTYTVAIECSKPPEVVFNHVVDLSTWWPEEYAGEAIDLNTEFVLRSGDGHFSRNRVTEFDPPKKLVWLTTESLRKSDNYDWSGTKMIFELTPKGDHTLLCFTYDGIVREDEQDRLAQICDFCIKDRLYHYVESFSTSIEIERSPGEVFSRLGEVSKWWSKDFEGASAQPGDEFVIHHPGSHYSRQKLVEVIPDRKIVWLVTESTLHWLQKDKHEWTNTRMVFTLYPQGENTLLHFVHEGLVPGKECYELCHQGWTMVILDRLITYITTGEETAR